MAINFADKLTSCQAVSVSCKLCVTKLSPTVNTGWPDLLVPFPLKHSKDVDQPVGPVVARTH